VPILLAPFHAVGLTEDLVQIYWFDHSGPAADGCGDAEAPQGHGYFLGLDLGQAQDYTALAVLERQQLPGSEEFETWGVMTPSLNRSHIREIRIKSRKPGPMAFACGHLERLPLNTSYPAVADHVIRLLDTPQLRGQTRLVVDATGVGRPVVDMFRQRGLKPIDITITGGNNANLENGWKVPKRDVIGAVQVLLQTDRLKFSADLPLIPQLIQEFVAYRVKIDPLTAHDTWRGESAHDDCVLAVGLAAYWGMRGMEEDTGPYGIIRAKS
jgi:hypothetical protein